MLKLACVAGILLLVSVYCLTSTLENPPPARAEKIATAAPLPPPLKKKRSQETHTAAEPEPTPGFSFSENVDGAPIEQVMRDAERLGESWDEYEVEIYQDVFKLPIETIETLHNLDDVYGERFTKLSDQISQAEQESEKNALAEKFSNLRSTYNVQLKDILGAKNYDELIQLREDFNDTAQAELKTSAQVYWY